MKIEMGESLFYSWLRHVKECQIVQTNWKVSPQWELSEAAALEQLMSDIGRYFQQKYGYSIFKGNTSLSQLLQQGECDVLGISIQPEAVHYYAVDVAFHEAGLNYGSREVTVMKVLEKSARTSFCMRGYLRTGEAEIIFASPKINPAVLSALAPCVEELNTLFRDSGYGFVFRIIANEAYNDLVLKPILLVSEGVADTSELFLRSYQMYQMFSNEKTEKRRTLSVGRPERSEAGHADPWQELKIGQLAQRVLGKMLCEGCASEAEIAAMQTAEYSKQQFDLQYPLLKKATESVTPPHYYAKPLEIHGVRYRMCCEWFEKQGANNDRPYLLRWLREHGAK